MDHDKWRGIHTILTTPFRDDLSLDREGMARNVSFAADSSAHVLVVLGTQGEFAAVTDEERLEVMRIAVETNQGRKPVMLGVSHSATVAAVELTRYAKELGADAVMATPPYFNNVNDASIRDHFQRIADVGVPVFLYNAPPRVGYSLRPALIAELAEIDGVAGIKQASQNAVELDETVALAADRMALIGGAESMIWTCLALGMIGNTATTASFWPESVVEIYDAAVRGDAHEAQALYVRLAEYRMLCKAAGHAAVVKAGMDMVGLAGGPVRPPLPVMTEAHKEHLARILREFGVLTVGARVAKG